MSSSPSSPPASSVVLVLGANGGSGTSLAAGALALAWARAGSGVWLVELDLGRGDLGDAWGLARERTIDDLAGVAGELDRSHLGHAACEHAGMRVLLASPPSRTAREWAPDGVRQLVSALRTASGEAGRVVIDGGAGQGGFPLTVADDADRIIIVCSPTVAAARRSRRLIQAIAASGADSRCGLVVNAGFGEAEMSARAIGRLAGSPILAELPRSRREGLRLAAGRWPLGGRGRLTRAVEGLAGVIG